MRILIAGASGLVGSNCLEVFSKTKGMDVIGTHYSFPTPQTVYFDTLNLKNPDNFDIHSFKPMHILHAGALTHVDYCEAHPEESYKQTVESTKNMMALAKDLNATFIYISTDYVFDGITGPYDEAAAVHPLSTYGRHKLEAEEIIRKALSNWLILRITNVYGDEIRNKNFIARLIKAGKEKESLSLRLPYDQYATPINAADVAKALKMLIESGNTGIFHIAGTDYLNRVQLAQKVLNYFPGHKVDINPCTTTELGQAAPRPLQGGLKAHKFLEAFPSFSFGSVDEYVKSVI